MPICRVGSGVLALSLVVATATPTHANGIWKFFGWLDELSGPGPFGGWTWTFEHCIGRSYADTLAAYVTLTNEYVESTNRYVESTNRVASLKEGQRRAQQGDDEEALKTAEEALKTAERALVTARVAQARVKDQLRTAFCRPDRSNQRVALSYEWSRGMEMFDHTPPRFAGDMHAQRHIGIAYMSLASIAEAIKVADLAGPGRTAVGSPWHQNIELGTGFGLHRYTGTAVVRGSLWRPVIPLRVRVNGGIGYKKDSRAEWRLFVSPLSWRVGADLLPGQLYSDDFFFTGPPERFVRRAELLWTHGFSYDVILLIHNFKHRKE